LALDFHYFPLGPTCLGQYFPWMRRLPPETLSLVMMLFCLVPCGEGKWGCFLSKGKPPPPARHCPEGARNPLAGLYPIPSNP
jgi:hypothetical protein